MIKLICVCFVRSFVLRSIGMGCGYCSSERNGLAILLTERPELGGYFHQREWDGEEAQQQIGYGQVDDEEVAGSAHLGLSSDGQTHQSVAYGPDQNHDGVNGDQHGQCARVQRSIGRVLIDQLLVGNWLKQARETNTEIMNRMESSKQPDEWVHTQLGLVRAR